VKIWFLCLAAFAAATPLRAQNIFVVLEDGVPKPVKAMTDDNFPEIETNGHLHKSTGLTFSIRRARIFGLGLVDISAFKLEITAQYTNRAEPQVHVYGRLKSDTSIKNCFFVLRLVTDNGNSVVFGALPDLPANQEVVYDRLLDMPMHFEFSSGRFEKFFFSDGLQLLTSEMPPMYVSQQRQRTRDYLLQRAQPHP